MFLKTIGKVFWDVPDAGSGGGGSDAGGSDLGAIIADSLPADLDAGGGNEPNEEEEKELQALEQDIRTKNPAMRGNIAIHRHQAVLTRARNQHAKELEEWTAKEKAWAEREAAIKKIEEDAKQLEWARDPDIQLGLQALALAEADQGAFVDLLLQDPRYAKLIQKVTGESQPKVPSDRPKPNKRDETGGFEYYDDEGIEQLLNWHGQKVSGSVKDEVLKEIQKEYGPLREAFQATTLWNQQLHQSKVQLDTMREKWPGFKEHEKEIKAVMLKDEKMSVEDAYREVVIRQYQNQTKVNEEELKKKWLAEMKAKPAAANGTVKGKAPERSSESGDTDLADIIRRTIPRE